MNRSIKVERLYSLGDYKNIKVIDELHEIPESVALNAELMGKLYMLLLANVDLQYYRYFLSFRETALMVDVKVPETMEKAVAILTETIHGIHTDFSEYFKNGNVEKLVE